MIENAVPFHPEHDDTMCSCRSSFSVGTGTGSAVLHHDVQNYVSSAQMRVLELKSASQTHPVQKRSGSSECVACWGDRRLASDGTLLSCCGQGSIQKRS